MNGIRSQGSVQGSFRAQDLGIRINSQSYQRVALPGNTCLALIDA
jgi:hypothetical protein